MNAFFPDICRVVCLRILAIIRLFRLCIAGNGFRHFLLHLIPSSHFCRESETQVTSDEAQASIGQSEKCLYRTGNSEREDKATSGSQWENRIHHILPAHGLVMERVVF